MDVDCYVDLLVAIHHWIMKDGDSFVAFVENVLRHDDDSLRFDLIYKDTDTVNVGAVTNEIMKCYLDVAELLEEGCLESRLDKVKRLHLVKRADSYEIM